MHQASVGFHCPECTRGAGQKVYTARSLVTRPTLTIALVAVNLVIFVADLGSAGGGGLGELGREGALWGPAVAAGDWWRPFTAGFIHANLMHVGFNMFLLYQLGKLLEPVIKWWGFAALYVMSLLGGSFLVLVLSPNDLTVGASGAVFGLMGATFVAMRSRGIDPFRTAIGPLIVINLVITFVFSSFISVGGHVGGLIAGGIGGWLLWEWGPQLERQVGRRLGTAVPVVVVAGAAVALYAASFAIA